jgi:D-galactarolactone cycloisomerase
MKIVDVRAHVLEARLSQPFSYARAWYASRAALARFRVTD